jgi:hypothetical protein
MYEEIGDGIDGGSEKTWVRKGGQTDRYGERSLPRPFRNAAQTKMHRSPMPTISSPLFGKTVAIYAKVTTCYTE